MWCGTRMTLMLERADSSETSVQPTRSYGATIVENSSGAQHLHRSIFSLLVVILMACYGTEVPVVQNEICPVMTHSNHSNSLLHWRSAFTRFTKLNCWCLYKHHSLLTVYVQTLYTELETLHLPVLNPKTRYASFPSHKLNSHHRQLVLVLEVVVCCFVFFDCNILFTAS